MTVITAVATAQVGCVVTEAVGATGAVGCAMTGTTVAFGYAGIISGKVNLTVTLWRRHLQPGEG